MNPTIKPCDPKPQFRAMLPRLACLCLAVLVFAQAVALGEPMTFQMLAQRLPATSNAIVAINATKVEDSPYGKREHWAKSVADAWAKQPVMIPPGASRLIMAAEVKPSTMDSHWEMSLIEMDKMPSIQELVDAEGGHTDRLWDKDAVYSPINAYFIPIEPTVLASITPAERSEIARWVRQPVKPEGSVTSDYIKHVVAGLSDKTDIVMAMDLDGAFGLPNIRKFLDDQDIKEIPDEKIDATARVLETMKGITLVISVGETVTGRATVEFERDAGLLKACAKPVMVAVLNRIGMRSDDVQDWTFAVDGKQVSMQGNLSAAGLRELLGLVQSPIPSATVAAAPKGPDQPPTSPAEASQRYFKTVDMCVKNLQQGTSLSATATSIRNTTKRIDQLPILGVDPELLQWSGFVTTKLKQAAGVLSVGQIQIHSRVAGVKDPDYVSYSYDQYGNATASSNVSSSNANKERRQVSTEQKAQAYQQALNILGEIGDYTPKIRAAMVAKYSIEF